VQLPSPTGLGKSALYISTEASLQTQRLLQILENHPRLQGLAAADKPSFSRIHSTHIHDLQAQDHILRYQVPEIIKQHNIGLLVIDSIAANYRPEFDKGKARKTAAESFARRSKEVAQLGSFLRHLARTHNVAVVVANQVADRFAPVFEPSSQGFVGSPRTQRSRPGSPPQSAAAKSTASLSQHQPSLEPSGSSGLLSTDDPLSLDHQQRFFTGWGDDHSVTNLKTPSLGLTWTNQLGMRIALLKTPITALDGTMMSWKRTFKVVFSAWCSAGSREFEITAGGVMLVTKESENAE
jgi:DNA repair protein RAD57